VREEVQRVKADIAANGKKQQDAIRAQVTMDLATIKGEIKLARSTVGAEAARQKSAVTTTVETAFAEVLRQTEEKVQAINASAEVHKKQAASAVTTRQEGARKFGVDEGKRSKDAMDAQAQEAMMRGQAKAAAYPKDERGEVQAEAVLAVAQEVATKLAEPGPEAQSKMEGAGNDLADGLSGAEKEVVKGIDDQTPKVTDELTTQAQALQAQFDGIRTDVHAGLDGFVSETNAKLDEAEKSAQTALQTLETQTITQIDVSIMQIQGMLDQEADALTTAIDTLVEKTAGAAERADRPDIARVQSAVSTAEATINDTADTFTAELPSIESAAGNEFSQGGNDVVQGMATIAGSVTSTVSEVTTAATKGLGMVGEKAQEGSKKIGEEWNGSLELAQGTVEDKYAEAISGMEKEMDKGLETGKGEITVEVNNAIAKNNEPLTQLNEKMDAAAKEAAEKYDAPWYEKLGRWLLNALLGFLEALAYLLAIVVLAVLAIVLIIVGIVKGLVILVIIGIALLVAVVVYVLYNIVAGIIARVKSAEKWWQYPLAVLVGVLDIIGIPNLIEGLIHRDIVNQRKLTVEEAGRRFGTGLLSLLATLLPIKVIRGAKGTKAPRGKPRQLKPPEPTPVEPTPVEPTPVEPTPVEPTPVEPTPMEPTPVEPTPVEPTPVEPTPVEPTPVEPTPPVEVPERPPVEVPEKPPVKVPEKPPVEVPEKPPSRGELPKSWDKFDRSHDSEFRGKLREFRGDENLDPNFRGGEGAIFLSEKTPFLTLKRWFQKRIKDMGESIQKLRDAKNAVDANPKLKADIEVVEIHERGSDWVVRDFDPTSIPLKDALVDANASAARTRVIAELTGTTDSILINVLKKLRREPPSENLHWSTTKQKILIIDMQ